MRSWVTGELLGLDFETTGVDRFNDVPVAYALVCVIDRVLVRSWSGLIDPGREIPADAEAVHGISTARARTEGMPLPVAMALVSDAVVSAGRRGVPLVGMRLDYDLTMLETQGCALNGLGIVGRGWNGPVLDAGVIDRHFDPMREGRRTLADLCAHYGIEMRRAHDAAGDAVASIEVLLELAARDEELSRYDLRRLHEDQIRWHKDWTTRCDGRRLSEGIEPVDRRDSVWPVAPAVQPAA